MKKNYESAKAEILRLQKADIITTSPDDDNPSWGDDNLLTPDEDEY